MSDEVEEEDRDVEVIPEGEEEQFGEDHYFGGQPGEGDEPKFTTITSLPVTKFQHFDFDMTERDFVPTALDLSNLGLTDFFAISAHPYLRYLTLSDNRLDNASLDTLKFLPKLVSLYLNNNKITSTTLPKLEYLQQLNLSRNPISAIDPIDQPNLQILILNNTQISVLRHIGIDSTPNLQTLSITHCRLTSMVTNYARTMEHLFLAYNKITSIESLHGLEYLKTLHLRSNKISSLEGLNEGLVSLEYLNMRENEITDPNELKIIKSLPNLRVIILTDNPVDDEMGSDIRPMVLMYNLEIQRVNKDLTDEEEIEYAKSLIGEYQDEEIQGEGEGEPEEVYDGQE